MALTLLSSGREQSVMHESKEPPDTLRYLDADHVNHPSGTLAGLTLWSEDDQKLGHLAGVLVEPASRRVEYFVIERRTGLMPRRYLLPVDSLPVLCVEDRKLVVSARPEDLRRFDGRLIEPFSDEDAIVAMFARPAA